MADFPTKTEKGLPADGQFSSQPEGLLFFSGKLGSMFHIWKTNQLFYAHESTCFEVQMASIFNEQGNEESAENGPEKFMQKFFSFIIFNTKWKEEYFEMQVLR